MERSKIEAFATKARNLLKKQIAARIELLRKSESTSVVVENKKAMEALEKEVLEKGLDSVIDEVAYTWFNRLCALRYMDAHNFNRPLVVTPLEGNILPEMLSDAMTGNLDLDKPIEDKINKLLTGEVRSNNAQAEIYRILLVSKCNKLNKDIPMLFERISDYTDLLLPEDLLSKDAIIPMMREALTDENCQTVEVIGWLYQYYISEKKAEVFKAFNEKNLKATAKEIPAATQLFTPEWIVRYLVENSLGRLWMLNHPESTLKGKMRYYIQPADIETDFLKINSPEEIKFCDPCCGSGHMLTYAFDLLYEIYAECGYTTKDAVEHIIKDNLYGIELDNRAGQLTYFALKMKAREKSRRFFASEVQPNVCVLHNVTFSDEELNEATGLFNCKTDSLLTQLLTQYEHADTLGSLITPCIDNIEGLKGKLNTESAGDLFSEAGTGVLDKVKDVLTFSEYLSKRYHVVVTNPPYLAPSSSDEILQNFAKKEYPDSKTDTGTMFVERNFNMAVPNGYVAMVTFQSWMFLSSFENYKHHFRTNILSKKTILSMAHIGAKGFDSIGGEVVSTAAYILSNTYKEGFKGQYVRLVDGNGEASKMSALLTAVENHNCGYYFEVSADQFGKIPGSPIAYWVSKDFITYFNDKYSFEKSATTKSGLSTTDNNKFLRFWYEVGFNRIGFEYSELNQTSDKKYRYIPHPKGGSFRKWYGNLDYIVDWYDNGKEIRKAAEGASGGRIVGIDFWFKEGLTWTDICAGGNIAVRTLDKGMIFDSCAPSCFFYDKSKTMYYHAYMNSKVAAEYLFFLAPTMHFNPGAINKMPVIFSEKYLESVNTITLDNVLLSHHNWDSFETSWDFKHSPLLAFEGVSSLEEAYNNYRDKANEDFYQLKANEEELNRIFIDIYGLQDELKPEESEKMVSIHKIYDTDAEIPEEMKKSQYALTKADVIKQFISYAVGCMFGRYSLDSEGLAYAGGAWDSSKYTSFTPDADNVIPVLSGEWFNDDIAFRFREFVKAAFGEQTLSANIKFIEDAIGMNIRNYFVKEFYKDHLKTYQKRPIYWLFSSPKGNFNALVYLHRYNENTASIVLSYLRKFRAKLSTEISALERENNSRNAKTLVNYRKMAEDLDDYERILYPIAMENIRLDLDDGVKVNYAKLGKALKKVPGLEKTE